MEDCTLVKLLLNKPEEGLKEAIAAYGGYVKTIAIRVIGRERTQDIEEILSDVFCTVWQKIDTYHAEKGSLKSWICTIARNIAIDRLRQTQNMVELTEALDFTPDFTDALAAKTNRQIVRNTVASLPEPEKTIFYRRYFLCDSVGRIAQTLQLDYKTVENRLYFGRQKLKQELCERGVIL